MAFLGCLGVGGIGGGPSTIVAPLIPWNARESNEPGAALLPIPAGQLDAVLTAVQRLWKQLEGRVTWEDLASIMGQAFRDADAQLGSIKSQIPVSSATGVQLDEIGAMVNLPRYGLDDDDYRTAIKVEVQTLVSSGTIPQILGAVTTIISDGRDVSYKELYPATFIVTVEALTVEELDLLLALLCDMPQAGVAALLATNDVALSRGFGYTSGVLYAGSWAYTTGSTPGISSPWGYALPFNQGC